MEDDEEEEWQADAKSKAEVAAAANKSVASLDRRLISGHWRQLLRQLKGRASYMSTITITSKSWAPTCYHRGIKKVSKFACLLGSQLKECHVAIR